jgi:hypothetical protein
LEKLNYSSLEFILTVISSSDRAYYVYLSIFSVIAISIYVSIDWDLLPANAQNSTTIKFLTYKNPLLGFTLQHPSNWRIDKDKTSDGLVQFFSKPHGDFAILVVSVHNVTRYLDTDTLKLKNRTSQQYALEKLNSLSKTSPADFKQIRSNKFNATGNDSWKIEYSLDFPSSGKLPKDLPKPPKGPVYNFEVFTVANGKIYTLEYNENFLKVPETLPLANKTVDSFQILR